MGFSEQLESLYAGERNRLFTYALSFLGDAEGSEDVVQDVFRKLCEAPVKAADLRAFVYRCVRNRALDVVRSQARRKRNPAEEAIASIYAIDQPAPWAGLLSQERAKQVEQALRTLRAEEREVLVLRIYGDMTFDSISKVLEAPLGTVTSQYRRALAKLRRRLQGERPG